MRGRPFAPGNCANPHGRPRTGLALAEYIRQQGGEDGRRWVDRLVSLAEGTDKRLALAASEVLLARGYGKPPDTTVTVNAGALRDLSDTDLEAALRVAERLSAA
jgi:hypothetical protein